jgi:hypothetical protein
MIPGSAASSTKTWKTTGVCLAVFGVVLAVNSIRRSGEAARTNRITNTPGQIAAANEMARRCSGIQI